MTVQRRSITRLVRKSNKLNSKKVKDQVVPVENQNNSINEAIDTLNSSSIEDIFAEMREPSTLEDNFLLEEITENSTAPADANVVEAPANANVVEAPANANVVEAPADANVVEAPADANVVEAPANANVVEAPANANGIGRTLVETISNFSLLSSPPNKEDEEEVADHKQKSEEVKQNTSDLFEGLTNKEISTASSTTEESGLWANITFAWAWIISKSQKTLNCIKAKLTSKKTEASANTEESGSTEDKSLSLDEQLILKQESNEKIKLFENSIFGKLYKAFKVTSTIALICFFCIQYQQQKAVSALENFQSILEIKNSEINQKISATNIFLTSAETKATAIWVNDAELSRKLTSKEKIELMDTEAAKVNNLKEDWRQRYAIIKVANFKVNKLLNLAQAEIDKFSFSNFGYLLKRGTANTISRTCEKYQKEAQKLINRKCGALYPERVANLGPDFITSNNYPFQGAAIYQYKGGENASNTKKVNDTNGKNIKDAKEMPYPLTVDLGIEIAINDYIVDWYSPLTTEPEWEEIYKNYIRHEKTYNKAYIEMDLNH